MKTFKFITLAIILILATTLSCSTDDSETPVPEEACELPDFAFTDAAIICPPFNNYQIGWEVTVINEGKTSGSTSVQAWLSQDNIPDNGDEAAAGGRVTDEMSAEGGTSAFNFGATLSVNVADYSYLILEIDHNELSEECNEDNNIIVLPIPSDYVSSCLPDCSDSTYFDIVAQEADLASEQILATNSSGILFNAGDVILFKTNEGRYGKMTIVDIDSSENNKLTFSGITYNSDGTIYKQDNSVVIRGTWSADLDDLIEAPADNAAIRDFFWQRVDADITYLTPQNEAKFKFCEE